MSTLQDWHYIIGLAVGSASSLFVCLMLWPRSQKHSDAKITFTMDEPRCPYFMQQRCRLTELATRDEIDDLKAKLAERENDE